MENLHPVVEVAVYLGICLVTYFVIIPVFLIILRGNRNND